MGGAGRTWARHCVSVWRRRAYQAGAWSVALLLVLALSAWLARRTHATQAPAPVPDLTNTAAATSTSTSTPTSISIEQWLVADKAMDWRVARLTDNPAVLAIEFPNLLAQGLTFNRVAALIEKKGAPRERVLTDVELAKLIDGAGDNTETFYQGHDYTGADLARFFSMVAVQQLTLNAPELRLRSLLLQEGLLREPSPGLYAVISRQAVIGFSAVQPDNPATPQDESIDAQRRASVLLHEFSHAQFFTRTDYQQACWSFWTDALDASERARLRAYLGRLDYDVGNEALMVNETQALLMHTPDPRAFNAAALGLSEALLESWRRRFRQAHDAVSRNSPRAPSRPTSNSIEPTP